MLHKNSSLKWIHNEHHSTYYKTMIYSDVYVAHYLETPIQTIGIFVPIFFIKFDIYVFFCAMMFLGLRALARHENRLSWLVGNHHVLHHKYPEYNYGEYWLDTLLGTRCPYKDEYIVGWIYL